MYEKKDSFKILNIDKRASKEEIKKRYKELAKIYHPDNTHTGNLNKFHEIAKAYEALTSSTINNTRYHYPQEDPITYKGGQWSSHTNTRFTKNTTFISLLAGCVVLISTVHIFYIQSSHSSMLQAADQHHLRSSFDLKKARTEAKLFGNERGIKRVLNHRLREFRKE
jgi:DnaJ-class molecular chaperone